MEKVKGNWGDVFRSAMTDKSVSVYALAKGTKIPYSTVKRLVNGVNVPNIDQFYAIANFLNITL